MQAKKFMLLDGYSLINRAFYAIAGRSSLTTSEGMPTQAIFGFINILYKFIEQDVPDALCVTFDMKKPTFRHLAYDAYKATRKKMPDDLAVQIPYIREVLEAMRIPMAEMEGYEADDLMGTLAKKAKEQGYSVVVVSGDRDLLQVVEDGITVKTPVTKAGKPDTEVYDPQAIRHKYDLLPKQLIQLKALMGDASDNIPGVKGVGEKTALGLLQQYGSLDAIFAHVDAIKGSLQKKLITHKADAYMSLELATIHQAVPIDFDPQIYAIQPPDKEKLLPLLQKLEFRSMIERFCGDSAPAIEQKEFNVSLQTVTDPETFALISKEMTDKGWVALHVAKAKEDCLYLSLGDNKAWQLALDQSNLERFHPLLSQVFHDKTIKKYIHDIKSHLGFLKIFGMSLTDNLFDTFLAAYLLDPASQKYALPDLAKLYLGLPAEVFAKDADFFAQSASITATLGEMFQKKLQDFSQDDVFENIEMPLPFIIADMEAGGIKIDTEGLKVYGEHLSQNIIDTEKIIFELAGESFNINSPKQLGVILFEKLGLPMIKKNKTGYSTDAEVLEELREQHAIVDKILSYRQLVKLKTTYVDAFFVLLDPKDHKIRTRLNQTGTVTGRMTSIEPNLQNIPYRQELGRQLRKVFISAGPEYILVGADYSQIELRILAHISGDENLIRAYTEGLDIHTLTAMKVFKVKQEEVTPLLRGRAKAINFGIIYGLGDFSLARDIGVTRKEAKLYIEEYLGQYPKVKAYMTQIVEFAREKGYVATIFDRRRYLPDIHHKNFNLRSFAERAALNAPIQGTAADMMKLAMVRIHAAFQQEKLQSRMILQVHDEILIDALIAEKERVKAIVKESMEGVASLKVPLVVEVKEGRNWYETK